MKDITFYDDTPFQYGYSSSEEIIAYINPILKKLIRDNTNKIIADIGCGCGRNLFYAKDFSAKMFGVDVSVRSLNFARQLVDSDKLELIEGDNLSIPLEKNTIDLVISDGVCHHTGDTFKALSECVRILKPSGKLYLAVYKKFRYYPFLYYFLGSPLRILNRYQFGNLAIENLFIPLHYFIYKLFRKRSFSLFETRNIFFDYFITPIATFHSKSNIINWVNNLNSKVIDYYPTSGNCHVFIISKDE